MTHEFVSLKYSPGLFAQFAFWAQDVVLRNLSPLAQGSLMLSTLCYFCLAICHSFPRSPALSLSAAASLLLPHFISFARDLHANAHQFKCLLLVICVAS